MCSGEIQDAHRNPRQPYQMGMQLSAAVAGFLCFEYCCFFLHVKAAKREEVALHVVSLVAREGERISKGGKGLQ